MKMTIENNMVIDSKSLLLHWQGHRNLTRRVIDFFPEEEFFNYSIGGMRPFGTMVMELLAIAAPGMAEIATGRKSDFDERKDFKGSKEDVLKMWDESTELINSYWEMIPEEKFQQVVKLFGMYEGRVIDQIFYFIDNEVHHRGQAYVYLRSLGITPPVFYER